jgi:hypothetical protein
MTEPTATPSRRGARTFRAACIVLATVAAGQAATTALSSKPAEHAEAKKVSPPPEAPKPPDPFSASYSATDDPHPEMQKPAGDVPPVDPALGVLNPAQVPAKAVAKRAAPLDVPIKDEEVLAHLDEGLALRNQGDMLGALTHLRAALKKMPDHPKLLYHTAQILDTMGRSQKALPYWKSLYQLGQGAGDFFVLAQERMADGPQVANEPEDEKEGKFTIVDLKDEPVPDATGGERVRLTAVLKKNTTEKVDVEKDMLLLTHFFDSVNKKRIARSQVPQPSLTCISPPLDWAQGTETFSFDYWQPDMTPQQLVKFGRCKYLGCTLEVMYKNKLQDSAATIEVLLKYASELPVPPPDPGDSILNSSPNDPGPQEPSLFPPTLNPEPRSRP